MILDHCDANNSAKVVWREYTTRVLAKFTRILDDYDKAEEWHYDLRMAPSET